MLLAETSANLKFDTKSSSDQQDLDKLGSPPKKRRTLPWNLDKTNSNPLIEPVGYEEESTEEDEVESEDTSDIEELLQKLLTFTDVTSKFVIRRMTSEQRQALQSQKSSSAISKPISTNSSMESTFQKMVTPPPPMKRKRLDDSDTEPGMTRKKPPARLQLELGYDSSQFQEWNALQVCIPTNCIFWLYLC